jgi:3-oxoacyl-[acyl-carrier protein] reductase
VTSAPEVSAAGAGVAGLVAVVSGAGRGIGSAITDALLDAGCKVAALDLVFPADRAENPDRLDIVCDITDEGQVSAAIAQTESELGNVAIVVNNAAIIEVAGTEETSIELWQRIMDVNVTGAFILARRCLPRMKAAGFGRIINIGSNSGKMGGSSNVVAYAASKAALHNLSRAWATELGPHGITANTVAACLIATDMAEKANLAHLVARVPVGRMGTPQEVAWTVLFLADRRSGYINGDVMDLNGGFYLD